MDGVAEAPRADCLQGFSRERRPLGSESIQSRNGTDAFAGLSGVVADWGAGRRWAQTGFRFKSSLWTEHCGAPTAARMTAQHIHSKKPERSLQGNGVICWQVWVEAGHEGRIFTYGNPENLVLSPGDLVRVSLRRRRQIGLVVEKLDGLPPELDPGKLLPIEALHQRAAVDPLWQGLLQGVAEDCHTSLFRTLKTALPPGWLGQRRRTSPALPRLRQWVEPLAGAGALPPPPPRQRQLLERLGSQPEGAWLQEILGDWGFSRSVVQGLLKRSLVCLQPRSVPQHAGPGGLETPRRLNEAQAQALEQIVSGGSHPAALGHHRLWQDGGLPAGSGSQPQPGRKHLDADS
jgi:hypothetical protein